MDPETGVISPGGIGFDINCGMRLVRTDLSWPEVRPRLRELVDALADRVPAGVGRRGFVYIDRDAFRDVLRDGAQWAVKNGYGWSEDLRHTEAEGRFRGADPESVSERAIERGYRSGRTMSRTRARKLVRGRTLRDRMERQGILVRSASDRGLAEEAGFAYKNVDEVAAAMELAGLSRRVAHLVPVANVKG